MILRCNLDALVRTRLNAWPQRPPGLTASNDDAWLRGRPNDNACQCSLKLPGSAKLRTLPDGLWLNFGGSPAEPFVDIFAIEACASLQNLLDKRSRFAPSTQSLMAVCPLSWLLAAVSAEDSTPRWRLTGVFREEPTCTLVLPVRDKRVLFGLKPRHFEGFTQHQLPHAHEFFVPMEALTNERSHQNPALQALISRVAANANILQRTEAR